MKISLIIIAHNAEEHINQCIESCTNQTYQDIDIVIVDDNSSDATVDIIKKYQQQDNRINLIVHSSNKSALQARKTAVQHAKYDYVWFIDSDDRIEKLDAVEILNRYLQEKNYPDMLGFGSDDYYETGELKRKFYDWGRKRTLKDWKFDSDFRPYTRVTKKAVLEKAMTVIPSDLYLYRHNDLFMFCLVKLVVNSKAFLDETLYRYTLSSASVTNQKDKESISKHIGLFDLLLSKYTEAALQIDQQEVNIEDFVKKERAKLIKYAIAQYKGNPDNFLHALREIYDYQQEIVISLTTYNTRIKIVDKVIKSLLAQTLRVDKIILWLDENEFSFGELPQKLTSLVSESFEIKFCPNYKSYKKLIPTLSLYPNATIITFDDDIDYPEDQVEKLVLNHLENRTFVIANVARNIAIKNGKLLPYKEWSHASEQQVGKAYRHLLPIGVGGVLYPQGSLNHEVMNTEQFLKLAPHGDDLWLKCMTLLNGRRVLPTGAGYELLPRQVEGTREIGLWQQVNKNTDSNFEQLTDIMSHYKVIQKLLSDKSFHIKLSTSTSYQLNPVILKLNDESERKYSPFKLANKFFRENNFYAAASIYSFLKTTNPSFKYYKINENMAINAFMNKHGGAKPRIRWDENIPPLQYNLAALDIIVGNAGCPKEYFLAELSKIQKLPDSHLLLANYEVKNSGKWLNNVNDWLARYGMSKILLRDHEADTIFNRLDSISGTCASGPLVTVFISVFNSQDTIEYAVESILKQSYKNIELIIVDDCSPDNTREVLSELAKRDSRIKLEFNEENRGTYYNRNYGLKRAKGKYFTVMDADDYALPDRIALQVSELSNNKKLVGVLGKWVRLKPNGMFCCRFTWTSSYMQTAVATLMLEKDKVVNSIGYFDCVRFGADTEYFERLKIVFGANSVKELDLPLCLSAYLESSLTGNSSTGVDFILGTSQIRLAYNKSWKKWHKKKKNLKIGYNDTQERLFFAPPEMIS
ncbi:MAG: glycosyltransferase family 2 protein [Colwellia sp.]